MCAVSATHDYFRSNVPLDRWDRSSWTQYQDIIERLTKLDEKFDQPDCPDPAKAAWMKEVEKRLTALENKPAPYTGFTTQYGLSNFGVGATNTATAIFPFRNGINDA